MYLITVYDHAIKKHVLDNAPITRENLLGFLLFQFTDLSAEGRRIFMDEVEEQGEAARVSTKGKYDVTVKKYSVEVVSQ